ncbi:MAG: hypothetical protein Fur0010_26890 [Bdellovibrio sp.]
MLKTLAIIALTLGVAHAQNFSERTGTEAFDSVRSKLEILIPQKTKLKKNCEVEFVSKSENSFTLKIFQETRTAKKTFLVTFDKDQVLEPITNENPGLKSFKDHYESYVPFQGNSYGGVVHHDTPEEDGTIKRATLIISDKDKELNNMPKSYLYLTVNYISADGELQFSGIQTVCEFPKRFSKFGIETKF